MSTSRDETQRLLERLAASRLVSLLNAQAEADAERRRRWEAITDPKDKAEALARMRHEVATQDHGTCFCFMCRTLDQESAR